MVNVGNAADPMFVPAVTVEPVELPPPTLRERAYELRFDPNNPPPDDQICLLIGDYPVGARANIIGIQGQSKVGKTSVIAALLGAALRAGFATHGDTFQFTWEGDGLGAVIHVDTEQSPADWHALATRSVKRSGLTEAGDRFVSLPLVRFARQERYQILTETLEYEFERLGKIDLVVIDGVADMCSSPNDEQEALQLIADLMALSHHYHCVIALVLHENPPGNGGAVKTRGHLGSELNRKAYANLRVEKDKESLISTIFGTDMRKRDLPQNQGFCFAWSDEANTHVFKGRASDILAEKQAEKAREKELSKWLPIFEMAAENGTNAYDLVLAPEEAAEAERDMKGTKNPVTFAAMKKRMQRAEVAGALRKADRGKWALMRTGQTGQDQDNKTMSRNGTRDMPPYK